jgi:hypothetical protein
LRLFNEQKKKKKSRVGMESKAQFLRKKQRILPVFESFMRYKINLRIDSIMRPILVPKIYLKEVSSNGVS